jgi:hypothetical protein
MNAGIGNTTQGRERRPGSWVVFAAIVSMVVLGPSGSYGQRSRPAPPPRPAAAARPAPARPAQQNGKRGGQPVRNGYRPVPNNNQFRPAYRPQPAMRPGGNAPLRPGQEHLPEWLARHQNMSPSDQENQLRHEPGFNRLSPDQQQRMVNTLHRLDSRPPQQQERTAARVEMFEHLSPDQKQQVRNSTAAFAQMPANRRAVIGQAFNDLRHVPPGQRQAILNSARFQHDYTPQERQVLSNILSIEPYEPQ